ncbi:PLP-dependent aminotransferase family protein [Massilia sp. TS11]|uniref:MocR-like pyridoxine biosynthesis transcription factor PdxR n=1 Tax=Massilia sp. TS11 TaxID=2908003 RepID=UPI001EDB0698|nr:PLP-dependent aminotransferase family protein [Massilia sp. TS11]MCG2586871.1 PLP-dependent aminotransferase family protein [Massilia sp. TS11]
MLEELLAARLDRGAPETLAHQLYGAIRAGILDASLRPGQRLPSSRQLALEVGLGRNTVIEAYARLTDEGYLVSRVGAGSFVAATLPEQLLQAAPAPRARRRSASPGLSRRAQAILDEVAIEEGGAFAPCVPDVTAFPFALWQRLIARAWRQLRAGDLRYAGPGGLPKLRAAIAAHVQLARQVRCTPEQVVIVNGAQHGLDLCARLLADGGERVWMEDPGYPGVRRVFYASELQVQPIRLDSEGMAPRAADWETPPRLIYITPSHQFPTGVVMSLRRRRALLEAAARHDCWIIEDDYDGEFRFSGRPLASLQGIDAGQRVIYVGTFSKSLFPGLRLAYLVLPEPVAERFARAAAQLGFEGRQVTQHALADFISEGHFAAHIRRMRLVYQQRRDLLQQVWEKELGTLAPLSGGDTGMHLIAALPAGLDEQVAVRARAAGLVAQPLASLYLGRARQGGIVLGYGAVHENDIARHARALARIVKAVLKSG